MIDKKSRHFKMIWDRVIYPAIKNSFDFMDSTFKIECSVEERQIEEVKDQIEEIYRVLRDDLKQECYGNSDGVLDNRKIGAIFCRTLIEKKVIKFDMEKAFFIASEKKECLKDKYNEWAVNNLLVNYKIAYTVGAHFVYLGLIDQLISENVDNSIIIEKLNNHGALFEYPTLPDADSFGQNTVIALARADLRNENLDMLLFGLQLYQMEMYTRQRLELSVFLDELEKKPDKVMELVKEQRKIYDL